LLSRVAAEAEGQVTSDDKAATLSAEVPVNKHRAELPAVL